MSDYDYIDPIRKAARKRAKARQTMRQATDELRTVCLQAKYGGVPVTQIALEAELSRQGVYDLIDQSPDPKTEEVSLLRDRNLGALGCLLLAPLSHPCSA